MFLVPKPHAGCNCLWIKTDRNSAKSFGRTNYGGACAFRQDDPIQELNTYAVVDHILLNRDGLVK